ncbi:Aspartyl protease [Tangfeifania diversioriginum]|uniref:Aspartyl protease n=2 Tax=Tangfeifania diversioriginum TaxID=1168035 RepID=A0A1M6GP62_9BACT|nr:Aspartyl protease [Tangfeifania diversioriginum]
MERLFYEAAVFFIYFWKMKITVPLQIIELEDDNYHLVISSVLPDGNQGLWVVDTGASKTVFDKTLSENFSTDNQGTEEVHTAGIGENPIETETGRLQSFLLGKMKVENLRVALLDLSHINTFYSKATNLKICGLIGSDFLLKHQATIDYKKKLLRLKL